LFLRLNGAPSFRTVFSAMVAIPITARGAEMLKAELVRLKAVDRPAIIQAIKDAREKGDLSENAEYDAARERQGFVPTPPSAMRTRLNLLSTTSTTTAADASANS